MTLGPGDRTDLLPGFFRGLDFAAAGISDSGRSGIRGRGREHLACLYSIENGCRDDCGGWRKGGAKETFRFDFRWRTTERSPRVVGRFDLGAETSGSANSDGAKRTETRAWRAIDVWARADERSSSAREKERLATRHGAVGSGEEPPTARRLVYSGPLYESDVEN